MKLRRLSALLLVMTLVGVSAACSDAETASRPGPSTGKAAQSGDGPAASEDGGSGTASGENSAGDESGVSSRDGSGAAAVSGSSKGSSKAAGSSASKGGTSSGAITLKVWGSTDNVSLLTAAAAYEAQHKNVKIKVQEHGKATISQLKMALSAPDTAPDITVMDQTYLGAAGTLNYLRDLNAYGAKNYAAKFITSTWQSAQLGGKQWGMPFDANTIAQAYNKDMLTAANAAVPKTYAGLKDMADKVRARYPAAYGYTQAFHNGEAGGKNWVAFSFFNWLWRMGGEILSGDYKTAAFDSQAGVDALAMMVDMVTGKQAAPTYYHDNFFNGGNQVATTNIGSWTYERMFGAGKKANFGVALLPVLKTGVPPYSGLGLYCYAVTSASKNPQAAFDFIAYYTTSKTYQLQYCKKNFFIPSLKEAHSDSFYSQDEWKVMIQQLEYSKYRPSVQGWDQIESNLADAISLAIKGTRTPKAVLDSAAKYANSILKKYS